MTILILAALATNLAVGWYALIASQRSASIRPLVVCVQLAFAFWYFIPAINVLFVGLALDDLPASQGSLEEAFFLVSGYHLAVTFSLMLFLRAGIVASTPKNGAFEASERSCSIASQLCLASSIGLFIFRFWESGPHLLYAIVRGVESARSHMAFYNQNASMADALVGLWEIVNISCALYLFALSFRCNFSSLAIRLTSAFAVVVAFVSTGTRVNILLLLFIWFVLWVTKSSAVPVKVHGRPKRFTLKRSSLLGAVALTVGVIAVALPYAARFSSDDSSAAYISSDDSVILDVVVSHNDMFRELAFTLEENFAGGDELGVDFALTPVTFLMPRFLGFDKEIPAHLIQWNLARTGIDLRTDEGNSFPGLIADYFMVYGFVPGALLMTLFILAFFIFVSKLATQISSAPMREAYAAVCLAYLFVSFRNIPGALVLVTVTLIGFAMLLRRRKTLPIVDFSS